MSIGAGGGEQRTCCITLRANLISELYAFVMAVLVATSALQVSVDAIGNH